MSSTLTMPQNSLGLVGHWTFDGDDISGTSVTDTSGNGNDGTTENSPTPAAGVIGQALSLNGSSQYVNVGSYTPLETSGPVTFSAWINAAAFKAASSDYTGIVSYGKSSDVVYGLSFKSDGTLNELPTFELRNSSGSYIGATGTALDPGKWYNLVGVSDGTTVRLYVDGVSVGTATVTAKNGGSTYSLAIGRDWFNNTSTRYFDGIIDDVRIYNRALSPDEVEQLYDLGR